MVDLLHKVRMAQLQFELHLKEREDTANQI